MDHFIQEINYIKNPDFLSHVQGEPYFSLKDETRIKEIINHFDSYIEYLTTNNIEDAAQKFMEANQTNISELKTLIAARTKKDKELNEILTITLDNTLEHVENYLKQIIKNTRYANSGISLNTLEEDQLAKLKNDGFLEFQIPQTDEFLKICSDLLESNRKKYEDQEDWRGATGLETETKEYQFLYKFIRENKIVELISAYKKMQMQVLYIAVDYAHNRQKWFRNNHTFNKLAPTNYYHYDADADVAKMLIYLSDVNSEDGPFKFVKGSNNLSRSIFLNYIHYSIDAKISPLFFKKENLYGRGLFLYRKDLLMKFPHAFMGSTHFGDDLAESSLLSKYLVDKTVTFNREKGAAVLFDGFRGIHAGGNADKGERLAVQVAFKKIEEPKVVQLSTVSKIKKTLKTLLGRR